MANISLENLPVTANAEVIVCGGGTAGAFAALAAAREGRDVLLIEQFGTLGGTATLGLTTPLMSSHIEGNPRCSYLTNEVKDRLLALGATNDAGNEFDPLLLAVVLEQLCVEAGVKLLYHTFIPEVVTETVNGVKRLKAVVLANKAGLSLATAKVFIDATGDGDVSVRAGASYRQGNPETGKNQPMSLRYILSGVDTVALGQYFRSVVERTGVNKAASVWSDGAGVYAHCCKSDPVTLTPVFEEAIANGDLTPEDHFYWQMFGLPGCYGSLAFNCPEFFTHIDGTNPEDLTLAQVNGKRAILRQLAFYRKYFKGFDKAYISAIAPMVGVRESREIDTDYILTAEDILSKKKFPDMFCQNNYPIDIHGESLTNRPLVEPTDDGKPWYEISYRSLLVKGIDNLLVAGRCIGADFIAEASIRIQPTVRSSGEAAGIAAALALQNGTSIRAVRGEDVRAIMQQKGADFAKA